MPATRSYHLRRTPSGADIVQKEIALVAPGPGQIRLAMEAASINFRDSIVYDGVKDGAEEGHIPLSDGVGRVESLGSGVTRFKEGDRVVASFFPNWIEGRFNADHLATALGGSKTDGVLAEHVILPEAALVRAPDGFSASEAATLPCAAVTAWHGLVVRGRLAPNETVLIQGTGGVAIFALQLTVALGARAIVLSSSDDKLSRAAALGASGLINYRRTADWDVEVLAQTDGLGVDHVLELGGALTFEKSLRAVAAGGSIAQIGVLTGFGPQPNLARLQSVNANINGICVGSRAHLEEVIHFYDQRSLRPVIAKTFDIQGVNRAYEELRAATHFGKITININQKI